MNCTVGSRELKNRLGTYLRSVREGATIVVTDRGRPIAEIRPIEAESMSLDERLKLLAMQGKIRLPSRSEHLDFEPISIRGGPISETITEERKDRF